MNFVQLGSRRRTIAGYFFPQTAANSGKLVVAAFSLGAVQTGFNAFAILSQSCQAAYRNDAHNR